MQRDDQRPPASGRPSLLSDAPQPDTSRSGILHGLEGGNRPAATAPARQRKRKTLTLAVAGIVVVGGAVAAMAWLDGAAEPGPGMALTSPSAPPAAAPINTAVAAPVAAIAPTTEAPAAAIVEDSAAVSPPVDSTRALKEMLNDAPAKSDHDELRAALERPHHAPVPSKPKVAEHKKVDKSARRPVQLAKKSESAAKRQDARQDSDVKLLAALMAHVQTNQPSKAPSTPGYQLKQCGLMNEAGAEQCRQHLCSTTARNEPECKRRALAAKAVDAS